jgi:hypothetical protein
MLRQLQSPAHLLGLRYRLLWAQARLRNGKFILYLLGGLLLCLAAVFMQLGGFGTATALLRSDRAEMATGIILCTFYGNAILIAVLLGFGMNSVFSDEVLRRYPVLRLERFAARQIISILEPLWLLILVLYLGFAIGFSLFGIASFWIAVPAAVLLAAGNYFPARILSILIDRIMATRHGPHIMLVVVMLLFMLPSLALRIDWKESGLLQGSFPLLRLLPPFSAAAVFTGEKASSAMGWTIYLVTWCIALAAIIYKLDRLPKTSHDEAGPCLPADATDANIYDRVAALFHADIEPLIGKILRYYVRSPQLRFNYLFSLFGIVPFTLLLGGRTDAARSFSLALGYISISGYLSMGAMSSNVFGFDGAGFRRYFLLPVPAKTVLIAAAIVPLILGGMIIPISIALWLFITPASIGGRMILMLFSCGLAGLFLVQALCIWISLLAPRAVPFKAGFGNRLSLAANVLMIGSILFFFFMPAALDFIGMQAVLDRWWVAPVLLSVTAAFYIGTLRTGSAVFSSRRERMLSTIERGC